MTLKHEEGCTIRQPTLHWEFNLQDDSNDASSCKAVLRDLTVIATSKKKGRGNPRPVET
jgi:hypothetical protein